MHTVAEKIVKEAKPGLLKCPGKLKVVQSKKMAFANEWEEEKKLALENGADAKKMLELYIYDHLKKKNLHDVAEIFAQEANLEKSQLVRCNENLLTEWWELFWPTFCSRMSNTAQANAQSSIQPSMVYALGKLAAEPLLVAEAFGSERLGFSPVEFLPSQALFDADNMHYTMPPSGSQSHLKLPATLKTPAQVTKDPKNDGLRRFDQMKSTRPVGPNIAYTIIEHPAGLSAAQALGKGPLGFPPVQFLPTQITPVPPPVNPSHLQMPFTIQPPPQVARASRNDVFVERSVQVESTYPGGQGSTYPPAAPYAGEANWKNQFPPAGEVQEARETLGIRRDLENVPNAVEKRNKRKKR